MKIGWWKLFGYGILFWMFLYITDLFGTPNLYLSTTQELEDLCGKPDLYQLGLSASQLGRLLFMAIWNLFVIVLTMVFFTMFLLTCQVSLSIFLKYKMPDTASKIFAINQYLEGVASSSILPFSWNQSPNRNVDVQTSCPTLLSKQNSCNLETMDVTASNTCLLNQNPGWVASSSKIPRMRNQSLKKYVVSFPDILEQDGSNLDATTKSCKTRSLNQYFKRVASSSRRPFTRNQSPSNNADVQESCSSLSQQSGSSSEIIDATAKTCKKYSLNQYPQGVASSSRIPFMRNQSPSNNADVQESCSSLSQQSGSSSEIIDATAKTCKKYSLNQYPQGVASSSRIPFMRNQSPSNNADVHESCSSLSQQSSSNSEILDVTTKTCKKYSLNQYPQGVASSSRIPFMRNQSPSNNADVQESCSSLSQQSGSSSEIIDAAAKTCKKYSLNQYPQGVASSTKIPFMYDQSPNKNADVQESCSSLSQQSGSSSSEIIDATAKTCKKYPLNQYPQGVASSTKIPFMYDQSPNKNANAQKSFPKLLPKQSRTSLGTIDAIPKTSRSLYRTNLSVPDNGEIRTKEQLLDIECEMLKEEMHRVQSFSIKEHTYLTRNLVEALKENAELTKEISALKNENQFYQEYIEFLFHLKENLAQELLSLKMRFRDYVERTEAAEEILEHVVRELEELEKNVSLAYKNQLLIEYNILVSYILLIKFNRRVTRLLTELHHLLSFKVEVTTSQLPEIDDENDNDVQNDMDVCCAENEQTLTQNTDGNVYSVSESEMDIFRLQEYLYELGEYMENFSDIDENGNPIHEISEPKPNTPPDPSNDSPNTNLAQGEFRQFVMYTHTLTTIKEESDTSNNETSESEISLPAAIDSRNTIETQENPKELEIDSQNVTTISDEYETSNKTLRYSISAPDNFTQIQAKVKESEIIIRVNSDEYVDTSCETLEYAITVPDISDSLNASPTQGKVKELELDLSAKSGAFDNTSYETLESPITLSPTQGKAKELETILSARSGAFDNTSYETLESPIALSPTQGKAKELETILSARSGAFDNTSYETLESPIALSPTQGKVKELETILSAKSGAFDTSYDTLESPITLSPTQGKAKELETILSARSGAFDNTSYETLESPIALSPTQGKAKKLETILSASSGAFDNTSYETLESPIALSPTQGKVKELETILSAKSGAFDTSYDTLESQITLSVNGTDSVNTHIGEEEWESESTDHSPKPVFPKPYPKPISWFARFSKVPGKKIIGVSNIQDPIRIHLDLHRAKLARTAKYDTTSKIGQEPKRLVSSSKAFKNFMKNFNKPNAGKKNVCIKEESYF